MQSATLVLRHSDINTTESLPSASATCGFWTDKKAVTTWNVDLRKLLGGAYKFGGTYQLRLNSFAHGESYIYSDDAGKPNAFLNFNVEGLSWVNCNYDVKTSVNTRSYTMLTRNLIESADVYDLSPNLSSCNFRIDAPDVNIQISLVRAVDNIQGSAFFIYPSSVFHFDIIALD